MAVKIYLIRHGETEGAEKRRYKGHIDVPLSHNGIEQIKRAAEYLKRAGSLNAVYCSDLSRAVRSAEVIAEESGLKPIVRTDLRERNFGVWEGMSFDEIREKWPDAFNAWANNPLNFSPVEGESTIEVRDRAVKALNEIMEKNNEDNIAIVCHGGINRVILCHLLGIPLKNIFRIDQDFAAINLIEFHNGYPMARFINYTI